MGKIRKSREQVEAERRQYIHKLARPLLGNFGINPASVKSLMTSRLSVLDIQQETRLRFEDAVEELNREGSFSFARAFYLCYESDVAKYVDQRLSRDTWAKVSMCGWDGRRGRTS